MILELLMALTIILVLTFGVDKISIGNVLIALAVAGLGLVAIHLGGRLLIERVVGSLFSLGQSRISSRRRILKANVPHTDAEQGLDALDEARLREHIEAHPHDAVACEILCERLRQADRLGEYAREMEYFLMLKSELTIEEKCSRYHDLADLYLNQLGRPDRAAEVLNTLIAHYPRHYQATLARRRLETMKTSAQ